MITYMRNVSKQQNVCKKRKQKCRLRDSNARTHARRRLRLLGRRRNNWATGGERGAALARSSIPSTGLSPTVFRPRTQKSVTSDGYSFRRSRMPLTGYLVLVGPHRRTRPFFPNCFLRAQNSARKFYLRYNSAQTDPYSGDCNLKTKRDSDLGSTAMHSQVNFAYNELVFSVRV
jgi:hypothetical protein